MDIRRAEPRDAAAIAWFIVMAEGEIAELFAGSKDPDVIHRRLEEMVSAPKSNRYSLDNCLVAEIDGTVAGSIISFPADRQPGLDVHLLEVLAARGIHLGKLVFEGEPGTYYLSTAGVDPKFRGRGLGTALLAAAAAEGARLGFARASLLVSKDKPRAMALYEKLGYAVVGEQKIADYRYFRMIKNIS